MIFFRLLILGQRLENVKLDSVMIEMNFRSVWKLLVEETAFLRWMAMDIRW